ncbi:MAG: Asp-tRNA(Asn)/Glu-tRNA(Gln) amidotransferase subunit GatB [Bacteroidia bacterium]|nr:Asp-tRNA(Asn)/Glu-tRNA(Gln) amidotransferase subunit GatB [Bacteroidia bacterium]
MNFEAVIGLEIHVEMKTRSKMFSSAPVEFGLEPNTLVSPNDIAFPGTMPTVNKQAVINAIRVANALHMKIDDTLVFDRKNYFYSDLPKGYQITQDKRPIGSEGYLDIKTDTTRRIAIQRLHIEEDTCKQLHFNEYTLLDYNRSGVPLIEIVSKPDIRSGEEAAKYVETIRSIVIYADVSDGKMEEGSLRCDVNISLRPIGVTKLGTKVEIKNLNSIANIQKAIEFEARRQEALLLSGVPIIQETRRFDEASKETITMRVKSDAVDYKYFTEPNIAPIKLSESFVAQAISSCPELATAKEERYLTIHGLGEREANIILQNKDLASYYDEAALSTKNYRALANWVTGEVIAYLNKRDIPIENFFVSPAQLALLVNMIESKEISNKQGRDIFQEMLTNSSNVKEAKEKLHISTQINDDAVILNYVNEVLDAFPESIKDYKDGKDRALGFLVGQVMKKSQGKVNPGLTSKYLLEELKKR